MAEKFKGLTVEIGGDTSKLSKALKDSRYTTAKGTFTSEQVIEI